MNTSLQNNTCDPERLESFLSGDLSHVEERDFTLHLNSCENCRRSLQQQAAEPEAWTEAERLLKPFEFDLGTAEEDYDSSFRSRSTRQPLQIQNVLAALGPTDDPAMLGRLGGYEVTGVVGAGGMGVVLKAIDKSLDRTVAIKVLAPHLATSGAARKRFAREAKAAAAVLHPNVIAIHSVSNDESLPYLVMPYVRGTSLQKRLDKEGPLSLQEILRIGSQIAAGLAAAHAQGLVHRDIKPANILLEDGVERVTITDFGLARAVDDATITHSGVIAGTPQYMSPEQARGEAVDGRSDLFSLGSVLYAICTGRPPFRAESSYGVLRRITDDQPTPIREINPDVPEWLCSIISKLMSKQAASRFASAEEVSDLFEQCLAHVQQPASVALPAFLIPPTKARHSLLSRHSLGVIAMTIALLLGVLALVGWNASEAPDIEGKWSGEGWGEVKLDKSDDGSYGGTYTDTFGKQAGEIRLKWSRIEQRFNGTWKEGNDRFGKVSVRLAGDEIRGAWTTSKESKIDPGRPRLADLQWVRSASVHNSGVRGIRIRLLLSAETHSAEMMDDNKGFDGLSIMGTGISGTTSDGKPAKNLVAVMAHGCRLESFKETEHRGKKYWDAEFFVPQGPASDGSNRSLSQKMLEGMKEQGVEFQLDHYRGQVATVPQKSKEPKETAWIERLQGKIDDSPVYGDKQGDLQLGLAIKADQRRVRPGDELKYEYVIRNVGKERVVFEYQPLHCEGHAPDIRNQRGEEESVVGVFPTFERPTYSVTLEPGSVHRIPHSVMLGKSKEGSLTPSWESPAIGSYTLSGGFSVEVRPAEEPKKKVVTSLSSGSVAFEVVKAVAADVSPKEAFIAPIPKGDVFVVEIYAGGGAKHQDVGKLVLALNAIQGVIVNIRDSGAGDTINAAIVRDPVKVDEKDADETKKETVIRAAIGKALQHAKVSSVRWVQGNGKLQDGPSANVSLSDRNPKPKAIDLHILGTGSSIGIAPPDVETEYQRFEGTWRISVRTIDRAIELREFGKDGIHVIKDRQMGDAQIWLDPSQTPRKIDITFTKGPDKGKMLRGIYEWVDDARGTKLVRISVSTKLTDPSHPGLANPGNPANRPKDFEMRAGVDFAVWEQTKVGNSPSNTPSKETSKADGSDATELKKFQGTWVLVSSEKDGEEKSEAKNPYALTFTGNHWKVHHGDEVAVEGTLKLVDVASTPMKFDLLKPKGLAPNPTVDYGIYEWKDDTLRYCVRNGPVGTEFPGGLDIPKLRPSEFSTKNGDGRTLYVWKQAVPAAAANETAVRSADAAAAALVEEANVSEGAAESVPLKFLADFPKHREQTEEELKTLTDPQFEVAAKARKLRFEKSAKDGDPKYYFPTGDGHTVIVMFRDGKWSGIQRIRGERRLDPEKAELPGGPGNP